MNKARFVLTMVTIFAVSLALPGGASALTDQWTGGAGTLWSSSGNWSLGAAPGSTDLVLFSTGSGVAANLATNNDIGGGASILGISNTLAPAGDISISGNPLTIGSSGIVFGIGASGATRSLAISTDITLSAPQIWSLGGTPATNKLTIGVSSANTVNLNGQALTLKWNTVAGQTMVLNSTISGTSAVNLLRIGNGKAQIRFNANNTFSGGTTIDQGGEVVQFGKDTTVVAGNIVSGPLGTGSVISGVPGSITYNNNNAGNVASLEAYGGDRTIDYNIVLTFSGTSTGSSVNVITSPGETNHKLTLNGTITSALGNRTITTDAATGAGSNGSGDLVLNGNMLLGTSGQAGGTFTLSQGGGTPTLQGGKIFANGSILETAGVTTGVQLIVGNGNPTFPTRVQLSGQNTYSGGTSFGAGSGIISLGSSSVMSGPTIVSGPLGTGTLTFNNGGNTPRIESVGNQTVANNMTFATTSSMIVQGSDNLTLTGLISGGTSPGGNLTKNGTGTLTLTNANTYIGATTVNAGTLLANNTSGSATSTGTVTVNGSGTLGGNGSVGGAVVINGSTTGPAGTLSPGNSIESLGVGSVQFNAPAPGAGAVGSILKFEIGPGGTADLVNGMGGALNISSTSLTAGSTLALVDLGAGIIPSNTKYTVISYNGTWNSNSFINAPNLGYVSMGSNVFQIRYQDTTPGGNFTNETSLNTTGRFVTLTAVPEFGSFLTMGLVGFCALGAVRLGRRYGFTALSL